MLKASKKIKFRKIFLPLLLTASAPIVLLLLLTYHPARYRPAQHTVNPVRQNRVSPYLTNVLSPQFYNGLQMDLPFDLVIIQEGINDVIAHSDWPKRSTDIIFDKPVVLFVPDRIVLMGTVCVAGAKLVITIELNPVIDQAGLLNLHVAKIKVGALRMTILARLIAEKIYTKKSNHKDQKLETQIADSLLYDKPFDPIFKANGQKARLTKISIKHTKLTAHLLPTND